MQNTITMVRMKPRNPKRDGMAMRTYTSASGARYSIGNTGQPSPVKIINDPVELAELREIPQFEIREFRSRKEMDDFLSGEVATLVRAGHNAVAPHVEELKAPGIADLEKKKKVAAILDIDKGDDAGNGGTESSGHAAVATSNENRGRVPSKESVDERQELLDNIAKLELTHADAIEKGRSDVTIDKWEDRLNKAKEALVRFDQAQAELAGDVDIDDQE